jgi:NAD(P)-dependent dehydrogenase (short-subunit alcohol dehydrogenase family)
VTDHETRQKTIVVTGASDGIGLECASQLAEQGHHVVLVGRNPGKVTAAEERIRHESPDAPVESFVCDFASLADVRELAAQLQSSYPRIDVLVSNAGTVFDKRTVTEDGNEATFQVNHLSGFLLTELLLDRIVASAPARIVITSSVASYRGKLDLDDLGFERGYTIMRAYDRSKLANVLYTRELAERLEGTGVTVNCVHPGDIASNIWSGAPWFARPVIAVAKRVMMKGPEIGGARLTHLATSPEIEGRSGVYYDQGAPKEAAPRAQDAALGQRLVDVSRELVGLDAVAGT